MYHRLHKFVTDTGRFIHGPECDARGGPLMEESLAWFRPLLDELEYPNHLSTDEAEASS